MNKVILMGRLTHDPEMKTLDGEKRVCRYRIAVSRRYNHQQADFFNCVAWNQNADFVSNYFSKGRMISIVGRLENSEYETRNGEKRRETQIIIEEQYFCENKTKAETGDSGEAFYEVAEDENDDMPF